MNYGVRLAAEPRDLPTVGRLARLPGALVDGPWTEVRCEGKPGALLVSARLRREEAQELRGRGVSVVGVRAEFDAVHVSALDGSSEERWEGAVGRTGRTLAEALTPWKLAGDAGTEHALLLLPEQGPSAQLVLEALVALGRDDARIDRWGASDTKWTVVRMARPPHWLLLRIRDGLLPGVHAFGREGAAGPWVEWGYAHPLPELLARVAIPATESLLVRAAGRWQRATSTGAEKGLYDVLVPRTLPPPVELRAAEGAPRFVVPLRLAPGPEAQGELWLADPERFAALEAFVRGASQEELRRVLLARLCVEGDAGAVRYLAREVVRPGQPRLSALLGELLGHPGFVRSPGVPNLYLPAGMRLVPPVRREELRALLHLEDAHLVLLEQGSDGLRSVRLGEVKEVPLEQWVEYRAMDQRQHLEALLERTVFDLPEVLAERPPEPARVRASPEALAEPPKPKSPASSGKPRKEPERKVAQEQKSAGAVRPTDKVLRARSEKLVAELLEEGGTDGGCWAELGSTLDALGSGAEAAQCLEAALFFAGEPGSPPDAGLAASMLTLLGRLGAPSKLGPAELAERARTDPASAALLAARVVYAAAAGQSELFADAPLLDRVLGDGSLPLARRLAWRALFALHQRSGDALGATRARERIVGALHESGLREVWDLPAALRTGLTLSGGGPEGASREVQRAVLLHLVAQRMPLAEDQKGFGNKRSPPNFERALLAVGSARLGLSEVALGLADEVEMPREGANPTRVLLQLYLDRLGHLSAPVGNAAWSEQVQQRLAKVEGRARDAVEWLRKRSVWLRTQVPEETQARLRGSLMEELERVNAEASLAPAFVQRTLEDRTLFDFECRFGVERALRAAIRAGNDRVLAAALAACRPRLTRVQAPGHRAMLIGTAARAAAVLGDQEAVASLVDNIVAVARAPMLSMVDLLGAVEPLLAALRRLGTPAPAERLLDALEPVARTALERNGRDGVRLLVAVSEGRLQLGHAERATRLLDECDELLRSGRFDPIARFEGASSLLQALAHWSIAERGRRCEKLFATLDEYRDNFTVGQYYETHKVLLLERLVDALTDEATERGDKVQAWLDAHEQSVRRRILADWGELCGRTTS